MTSDGTLRRRLLGTAETLLEDGARSSAFRRRAVSSAYYAVFHTLSKLCVGVLLPNSDAKSGDYRRVYRSLDHGPIKNAFGQNPLKDHPRLRRLGDGIVSLQAARIDADYLPPNADLFPIQQVRELIDQARQLMDDLDKLSVEDRRLLATCLMFKGR